MEDFNWPKIDLFPRLSAIGSKVVSFFNFIPDLGITHGDHFQKTGAAAMLDESVVE